MSITLADIAKQAGVSTYTVSCALRGKGRVNPKTAKRIKALARKCGYVPSGAAQVLAQSRQRLHLSARNAVIAAIRFGDNNLRDWEDRENQALLKATRALGFDLEIIRWHDYPSGTSVSNVLWNRGVQGLILLTESAPPEMGSALLTSMKWNQFSVVKISRGLDKLHCHTVRYNPFMQTKFALKKVLDSGFKRIGALVTAHSASAEDDVERLAAFRLFPEFIGATGPKYELHRVDRMPSQLPNSVRKWIHRFKPDVILAFPSAWRVRLNDAGFRTPEDFSFVGVPVLKPGWSLSGVANTGPLQDRLDMEWPMAIELLKREMSLGGRGIPAQPLEILLPVIWQKGQTMNTSA